MGEIVCHRIESVGKILISNEARLNALSEAMWRDFLEAVNKFNSDPSVRVIVIGGAGERAFSAGADITEFSSQRSGEQAKKYNQLNSDCFDALRRCGKPTIAMISGHCLGGGFLIALACDLRIAAKGARFSLPPAKLGIGFDARWLLPIVETLSPHFIKELLFCGAPCSGSQAQSMGLLNRLVAPEKLEETVFELAREIAANAPLTVASLKRSVDTLMARGAGVDFAPLDAATAACFASEDYVEGQAAFLEKRKPEFKGM